MNLAVGLVIIFVVCLFLGLYATGKPTNIQVNVEYTNGILTATGILFGIWTIVLGTKPKTIISNRDATKKFLFENNVKDLFFASLFLLVMNVIFLTLTAVNVFSPYVTLIMVTTSFIYTALFLAVTLRYYIFRD